MKTFNKRTIRYTDGKTLSYEIVERDVILSVEKRELEYSKCNNDYVMTYSGIKRIKGCLGLIVEYPESVMVHEVIQPNCYVNENKLYIRAQIGGYNLNLAPHLIDRTYVLPDYYHTVKHYHRIAMHYVEKLMVMAWAKEVIGVNIQTTFHFSLAIIPIKMVNILSNKGGKRK